MQQNLIIPETIKAIFEGYFIFNYLNLNLIEQPTKEICIL